MKINKYKNDVSMTARGHCGLSKAAASNNFKF